MAELTIKLATGARTAYQNLLLIGDDAAEVVASYLDQGQLYLLQRDKLTIGVALVIPQNKQVVELKNLGLLPQQQHHGYGKWFVQQLLRLLREQGYQTCIVGTANSSIANIQFYQRVGFRMDRIKHDFFATYPQPIYENKLQAIDMLMFKQEL